MLVDLGRNDVGRVAEFGSVRLTDFMTIERYSHVMHLRQRGARPASAGASTRSTRCALCFPAGTVSGAPKVRAMEIIDELEPVRRGPYAGAVGYVGWGAQVLDTAIACARAYIRGDRAWVQAGAGIVAIPIRRPKWRETEPRPAPCCWRWRSRARHNGPATLRVRARCTPMARQPLRRPAPRSSARAYRRSRTRGRLRHHGVRPHDIPADTGELIAGPDGVTLKDLGSSNGTYVNGRRVTTARLTVNDAVTFGKVGYQLEVVPVEAERPSTRWGAGARSSARSAAAGPPSGDVSARKLSLLLSMAQKLTGEFDLDRLLDTIAAVSFEVMRVDRVAILLAPGQHRELITRLSRARVGGAEIERVSGSIVRKAMDEQVAVLHPERRYGPAVQGAVHQAAKRAQRHVLAAHGVRRRSAGRALRR
jgi:hypothetical protein